jgi:hypothetical protein
MKHLIFLAFAGAMLHAQTVTINDTIRTAVGNGLFSGTITVTLNNPHRAQPLYSGNVTLAGWQQTVTVVDGVFSLTLYANDQIVPGGTSYTATYSPTVGKGGSETWVVSSNATTIKEIRSTTVPTPRTMFTPSQITQASATLGQALRWNGSTWAPAAVLTDPMTSTGDLITRSGGVPVRVGIGSTGQVLTVAGGLPTWASGISGNAATATALAAALTSGRVLLGNGTGIPATDAGLEYDPLAGGLGRLRLTNSAANTGLWISQTGEGRALNILANGPATSLGQVVVDSQTATSGGVLWVGASGSGFTNTTTGAAYVWVSSASASGNALMVRNAGSGTALTLKNDLNSRLAFLDGSTNTTESAVVGSFNALTTGQAISVASSNNGFSASSGLIRANVAGATSTGNAFVADMSGTGTAFRANTSKGFGLDVQSSSSTAAAARIFTSGQGNNDALSVVVYNAPSGTGKAFSVYGGVNGGSLNAWIDSTGGASFSGSVSATSVKLTGLAEPAANAGNEGLMVYIKGTSGVSGSLRICAQLTDGSYAWVPLF